MMVKSSLADQVKNELRFELSGIGRRPAAKDMGVLRHEVSGVVHPACFLKDIEESQK
jgi:hypothetical protein